MSVPHQISETTRDACEISSPLEEIGAPSKNMTSDIAPELVKYPKVALNFKIMQNNV